MASHGTLLPHVFMGDVLGRIGQCLAQRDTDGIEAASILGFLEEGMAGGDRETRNVIAISFARDAPVETFFAQLQPLLGPRLRAQLGR